MATNRITVQSGYELPFDGVRRKVPRQQTKRRQTPGMRRQQAVMKACAMKWRKSGGDSYRAFMKHCLKGR